MHPAVPQNCVSGTGAPAIGRAPPPDGFSSWRVPIPFVPGRNCWIVMVVSLDVGVEVSPVFCERLSPPMIFAESSIEGVTGFESAGGALDPAQLFANTSKVYVTPLVRPFTL